MLGTVFFTDFGLVERCADSKSYPIPYAHDREDSSDIIDPKHFGHTYHVLNG